MNNSKPEVVSSNLKSEIGVKIDITQVGVECQTTRCLSDQPSGIMTSTFTENPNWSSYSLGWSSSSFQDKLNLESLPWRKKKNYAINCKEEPVNNENTDEVATIAGSPTVDMESVEGIPTENQNITTQDSVRSTVCAIPSVCIDVSSKTSTNTSSTTSTSPILTTSSLTFSTVEKKNRADISDLKKNLNSQQSWSPKTIPVLVKNSCRSVSSRTSIDKDNEFPNRVSFFHRPPTIPFVERSPTLLQIPSRIHRYPHWIPSNTSWVPLLPQCAQQKISRTITNSWTPSVSLYSQEFNEMIKKKSTTSKPREIVVNRKKTDDMKSESSYERERNSEKAKNNSTASGISDSSATLSRSSFSSRSRSRSRNRLFRYWHKRRSCSRESYRFKRSDSIERYRRKRSKKSRSKDREKKCLSDFKSNFEFKSKCHKNEIHSSKHKNHCPLSSVHVADLKSCSLTEQKNSSKKRVVRNEQVTALINSDDERTTKIIDQEVEIIRGRLKEENCPSKSSVIKQNLKKSDSPPEKNEVMTSTVKSRDNRTTRRIYYDPQIHWCQICNIFPSTYEEYLVHLYSMQHKNEVAVQRKLEFPWQQEFEIAHKTAENRSALINDIPVPIRGLSFISSTTAWYCKLCNIWMGDMDCASIHLKSDFHDQKYQDFIDANPSYETKWNTERKNAIESSFSSNFTRINNHVEAKLPNVERKNFATEMKGISKKTYVITPKNSIPFLKNLDTNNLYSFGGKEVGKYEDVVLLKKPRSGQVIVISDGDSISDDEIPVNNMDDGNDAELNTTDRKNKALVSRKCRTETLRSLVSFRISENVDSPINNSLNRTSKKKSENEEDEFRGTKKSSEVERVRSLDNGTIEKSSAKKLKNDVIIDKFGTEHDLSDPVESYILGIKKKVAEVNTRDKVTIGKMPSKKSSKTDLAHKRFSNYEALRNSQPQNFFNLVVKSHSEVENEEVIDKTNRSYIVYYKSSEMPAAVKTKDSQSFPSAFTNKIPVSNSLAIMSHLNSASNTIGKRLKGSSSDMILYDDSSIPSPMYSPISDDNILPRYTHSIVQESCLNQRLRSEENIEDTDLHILGIQDSDSAFERTV